MKYIKFLIIIASFYYLGCKSQSSYGSNIDEVTAIKIAEDTLQKIYDRDEFEYFKPFKAKLINNRVWIIVPSEVEDLTGYPPVVEVKKKDGKIIKVRFGGKMM